MQLNREAAENAANKSNRKMLQINREAAQNVLDLTIDQDIKTIGGKESLLYDSGPGTDIILMFGTEENKDSNYIFDMDGRWNIQDCSFSICTTLHNPWISWRSLPIPGWTFASMYLCFAPRQEFILLSKDVEDYKRLVLILIPNICF